MKKIISSSGRIDFVSSTETVKFKQRGDLIRFKWVDKEGTPISVILKDVQNFEIDTE